MASKFVAFPVTRKEKKKQGYGCRDVLSSIFAMGSRSDDSDLRPQSSRPEYCSSLFSLLLPWSPSILVRARVGHDYIYKNPSAALEYIASTHHLGETNQTQDRPLGGQEARRCTPEPISGRTWRRGYRGFAPLQRRWTPVGALGAMGQPESLRRLNVSPACILSSSVKSLYYIILL